jgi:lipoprotein-releasing system permease protein
VSGLSAPVLIVSSAIIASILVFLLWRAIRDFARRDSLRGVLQSLCALQGVLFAGFTFWTTRLPRLHGAAWSLRDLIVRSVAIATGAIFLVGFVTALLPLVLDRLENGAFPAFIAARHVRAKKSGFLTLISGLSIFAVALASFSLSSAISVMGGFSADLKRKILGNNAHIVIDTTSQSPWSDYASVLDRVAAVPGVVAATPIVQGEVMVTSASNLAGVIVHGIDTATIGQVIDLRKNIEAPSHAADKLQYLSEPALMQHIPANEAVGIGPSGEEYDKGPDALPIDEDIDPLVRSVVAYAPIRPGIVIGRELGKTLHVYVGDEVTLVSPLGDLGPMGVMPRTRKFRIAGIFYSGMYEYDATHVYTTLQEAQTYFTMPFEITAIHVKVRDAENADLITPKVAEAVGRDDLRVRDWREMNKNLFSALKLERIATFLILSIEVIVASFCIICTLLLLMAEKAKEIAILKALGASDGAILRTFIAEGVIIGGIGTVIGVSTGASLCAGLAWFGLRLDPDVYYIDRLPINVSAWDYATVTAATLTICAIATVFPAMQAAALRPVDGLRYE